MHLIFLAARTYPYWALALVILFCQLGIFFRRKGNAFQWYCWSGAGALLLFIVLWFAFRGDLHSDDWVRYLFGD